MKNEYWENFYHNEHPPLIPSQFAAFAMNEFPDVDCVVDIGCGNGRDSFFFAGQNKLVFAVDGSEAAIEACEKRKQVFRFPNLTFCNSDISNLIAAIAPISSHPAKSIMLYSRFVMHTLSEDQEEVLVESVSSILRKAAGVFITEFRTTKDSGLKKETAPHFRRFVDPGEFLRRCKRHGLNPTYFVEGTGFAKYKNDDAHVARVILQPVREGVS